jgi:hypothetical protein
MTRITRIVLILLLLLGGLLGMVWISSRPLLHPGQALFPLQRFSEQVHAAAASSIPDKYDYLMQVLHWRTDDLRRATATPGELMALAELNRALDQVVLVAAAVDPLDRPGLNLVMRQEVGTIRKATTSLILLPAQNPEVQRAMQAKLNSLEYLLNADGLSVQRINRIVGLVVPFPPEVARKAPGVIDAAGKPGFLEQALLPFPRDGQGTFHTAYPLSGAHISVLCTSCHSAGYEKIPAECSACHAKAAPSPHYLGPCALCHNPTGWQNINFDHAMAGPDCQICHEFMRPAGHYVGQCSACHTAGTAWRQGVMSSHARLGVGSEACSSCHLKQAPAKHYGLKCDACHETSTWKPVQFDHAVAHATNCQSCHAKSRPDNHFPGQCSTCHEPGIDWKGASFNHANPDTLDCQSCHASVKPANHFSAQCSTCHEVGTTWKNVTFSHADPASLDCQSCHSGDRPARHYQAQCSTCHSSAAWTPATFNHKAMQATNCKSCHAGSAPAGHYSYQCSLCHTTSGWARGSFKHSFNLDHGGANGNCATCHPSGPPATDCKTCHAKRGGGD